jgi:hypothetical protein
MGSMGPLLLLDACWERHKCFYRNLFSTASLNLTFSNYICMYLGRHTRYVGIARQEFTGSSYSLQLIRGGSDCVVLLLQLISVESCREAAAAEDSNWGRVGMVSELHQV